MPYRITFPLGAFDLDRSDSGTSDLRAQCLYECLKALTAINVHILRFYAKRGTPRPHPYNAGVRYEAEPEGQEDWLDAIEVLRLKAGDCEDLACWVSAHYQMQGVAAHPIFVWRVMPDGGTLYHIQVLLPDGSIEDPSKHLGMR